MHRSKKTMKSSKLTDTSRPASVTPRSGTESSSIWRSTENENVNVPTSTASVALSNGSRYQRRSTRAEKVPVAIWTTSTVTVTTKPVSAADAPTIDVNTALGGRRAVHAQRAGIELVVRHRDDDARDRTEHGRHHRHCPQTLERALVPTKPSPEAHPIPFEVSGILRSTRARSHPRRPVSSSSSHVVTQTA